MASLGIVFVGTNLELRIISLIVRAREVADAVKLIDLGSTDDTIELAAESDCEVIEYAGDVHAIVIAKLLKDMAPYVEAWRRMSGLETFNQECMMVAKLN